MIVALVIGIIMVTAVILPLSSEYSEAKTFTNGGIVRMEKYDDSAEITAIWDHTKPNEIKVNDEIVSLPKFVTSGTEISLTVSGTADFMLRYVSATQNNQTIAFIDNNGSAVAGVNSNTDATITVSAGTVTFTNGTDTKTGTYTDSLFFVSNGGDYIMKAPTDTSYLNGDSEIVGIGRSKVGSSNYSMYIAGNIEDGWTAQVTTGSGVTVGDVTGHYSQSNGYIDLYEFTSVTFDATLSGTDYPITYNQVIVPYEVSADPDNPAAYKSLVMVIPLMSFVVLVVAAAAMIYLKKD